MSLATAFTIPPTMILTEVDRPNLPQPILSRQEREVLADRIIDRLRADANNTCIQLAAELDRLRYENETDYWLVMRSIEVYAMATKQRIVNDSEVYRAVKQRMEALRKIGPIRNRLVGVLAPELRTNLYKVNQDFEAVMLAIEDGKRQVVSMEMERSKTASTCHMMVADTNETIATMMDKAREDEKAVRDNITRLESQLAQLEQIKTQKLTEDPQLAQAFKSEQKAELNRVAEKAKIEITNFAKNFFDCSFTTRSVEDHATYKSFIETCLKSIQFLSSNILKVYLIEAENNSGQDQRIFLAQSLFEHASSINTKIKFYFDASSGYSDRHDEFPFEYFARILSLLSIDRVSVDSMIKFLSELQTYINQVDRNFYENKDYFLKCKIFNRIRDFGQTAISESMTS